MQRMDRKTGMTGVFFAALLTTTAANAIPIVDTVDQNIFLQTGNTYSYTHNLLDDGFNPGTTTATSGTFEVQFSDDADAAWEVILIVFDRFDFNTNGLSVSSSASPFSNQLEIDTLAKIDSTGMLDITIASLWGDFFVGQSVLTIETTDNLVSTPDVRSIPEPGVLGLLCIGLIGTGVTRRKGKT